MIGVLTLFCRRHRMLGWGFLPLEPSTCHQTYQSLCASLIKKGGKLHMECFTPSPNTRYRAFVTMIFLSDNFLTLLLLLHHILMFLPMLSIIFSRGYTSQTILIDFYVLTFTPSLATFIEGKGIAQTTTDMSPPNQTILL